MLDVMEIRQLSIQLSSILEKTLIKLNRQDRLEDFLRYFNEERKFEKNVSKKKYRQRVLVIGQCYIETEILKQVAEDLGISGDRFDFYPEYTDGKKYDFENLKYTSEYGVVFFGATPHKGKHIDGFSSAIALLESAGGNYPPCMRLGDNGLKITKSSFEKKVQECIDLQILDVD